MKLSKLFLVPTLVGTLGVMGCGSDSSGSAGTDGMNGNGEGDPDVICADCAPGRDEEDCRNDVLACNTLFDPGPDRDECLDDAAC